jgi:hypothetical protein
VCGLVAHYFRIGQVGPCYNKLPGRGGVASIPVVGCLSLSLVLPGFQGGGKVTTG